ncbi:MAG: response regulator [Polyangiaceae bacterium]|nr:ATP-binding protein [Polyangiaceae bacterium]NUQ76808.1 response regulator [Polyangiaceae bacterium]
MSKRGGDRPTSGEHLRVALEAAGVGTFCWDLDTREIEWSPQHELLFDLAPGSFEGTYKAFLRRIHPDDRHLVGRVIRRALLEQSDYEVEFRVPLSGSRLRWLGAKGRFLRDPKGAARLLTGVAIDITDRKRAEDERAQLLAREQKARQQAEQALRLKDEFLATVSHELRTPLTAILGWARILYGRQSDPASVARAIDTIERNAKGLAQIVEDILDVSRIVSGKLLLEFGPVDLVPVIEAAATVVMPAAEAKGVHLKLPPKGPPCVVWGDPDRLQQVVWNLLSNAVKFTPEGGSVETRLERGKTRAQIQVIDTGQGIDVDFLPFMFDRFRQADSTTTRRHGGLGLGLALVRHLMELHGGTVQASSEGSGRGSTFTVTLPIQPELLARAASEPRIRAPETPPQRRSSVTLRGLKVLAVDDEPDARELVTTVLEHAGATVITVGTAPEAFSRLTSLRPDVLVCDISMPIEDGYSLIRRIRALASERGGRTPAIALTTYAREEDRRKALAAGFEVHVPKPVDPAQLVDVVARITGRSSA